MRNAVTKTFKNLTNRSPYGTSCSFSIISDSSFSLINVSLSTKLCLLSSLWLIMLTLSATMLIALEPSCSSNSFDDCFVFYGDKRSIGRQIGNAVPPLLAKAIADRIDEMLQLED